MDTGVYRERRCTPQASGRVMLYDWMRLPCWDPRSEITLYNRVTFDMNLLHSANG